MGLRTDRQQFGEVVARWWWPTVLVLTVVALLVPLVRPERNDSLPLSNYPMFTGDRDDIANFRRAIGVDADGREQTLPPTISGGTVEVIHAARNLTAAIYSGEADELCVEIAGRAAVAAPDVVTVLVVTEHYDVVDALTADDPRPIDRQVHADCAVTR